jgi:hypothetical protein
MAGREQSAGQMQRLPFERAAAYRPVKISARRHEHGGAGLARRRALGAFNRYENSALALGEQRGKTAQEHVGPVAETLFE